MKISNLTFKWIIDESSSNFKAIKYIEFVINGKELNIIIKKHGDGIHGATRLGGTYSLSKSLYVIDNNYVKGFSEINKKRIGLYFCNECGDVACGCNTFEIEITDKYYIWKMFGTDNEHEETAIMPKNMYFVFGKNEYLKTFSLIKEELKNYEKEKYEYITKIQKSL